MMNSISIPIALTASLIAAGTAMAGSPFLTAPVAPGLWAIGNNIHLAADRDGRREDRASSVQLRGGDRGDRTRMDTARDPRVTRDVSTEQRFALRDRRD